MSKGFTKLFGEALWRSKRFRSISDQAKLLYLYFLGNSHSSSIGAYTLPDGYAQADLGWPLDQYKTTRAELTCAGLILFDDETSEIYVTNWFKHSPPQNEKHAQGCERQIMEINSMRIAEVVDRDFRDAKSVRMPTPDSAEDPKVSNALITRLPRRSAHSR